MVKKNGTIIRYYENGIQEHEWNYKDDVLDGFEISYYESGKVKQELL